MLAMSLVSSFSLWINCLQKAIISSAVITTTRCLFVFLFPNCSYPHSSFSLTLVVMCLQQSDFLVFQQHLGAMILDNDYPLQELKTSLRIRLFIGEVTKDSWCLTQSLQSFHFFLLYFTEITETKLSKDKIITWLPLYLQILGMFIYSWVKQVCLFIIGSRNYPLCYLK